MKVKELSQIFNKSKIELLSNDLVAIYLYGSQIPKITKTKIIQSGKEVDLLIIKEGYLKDGLPPIKNESIRKVLSPIENVVISFNGVWNNIDFNKSKYYFDVSGNGVENIKSISASTKISFLKKKILVWGKDIYSDLSNVYLTIDDKNELLKIMSSYVRREFFKVNTTNNLKGIYKNALFLVSLFDDKLLIETDKNELEQKIDESEYLDNKIKTGVHIISENYKKGKFEYLKNNFDQLITDINYESF